VLRFPAHLPDPSVGFLPVLRGTIDLALEDGPQRLRELIPGTRMQVYRVQHGAPDIVLLLVIRPVAGPNRKRALVTREMRQRFLVELTFAADAVHHLQVIAVAAGSKPSV
jgi:hypothetical protein